MTILIALTGYTSASFIMAPSHAHAADELAAPEVVKVLTFLDKIDSMTDEFRFDFILKVPAGFINPETGAAQTVNGQGLRLGYHATPIINRDLHYIQTMGLGTAGAQTWAQNTDEFYTVHEVIPAGDSDLLVISAQGNLDLGNGSLLPSDSDNVFGGTSRELNFYVSYGKGLHTSGLTAPWVKDARLTYKLPYQFLWGREHDKSVVGPLINVTFNNVFKLWSGGQANWGQSVKHGLNNERPGVLPPNSIAVDLVNQATNNSNAENGPAGSFSNSFWYAWVHEDGSLVKSINTAPIHFSGIQPRSSRWSKADTVSKNMAQPSTPTNVPHFGFTWEQYEQGLTTKVGINGSIDFNGAGGNGYYRMMVWPESRNPMNVKADHGGRSVSYTAADLFDASGVMTAQADAAKWPVSTVFYNYTLENIEPPHIDVPEHNSYLNTRDTVVLTGTGAPGHTISLKLASGKGITDFNAPTLTTIVDGRHDGVQPGDVLVDASGNWSYEFTPQTPLADGIYTVVAVQTNQNPGSYNLTSGMSNPNEGKWGNTFTIKTSVPTAPMLYCPSSPTDNPTPTIAGGGTEEGSKVYLWQDGERLGEVEYRGSLWSYTVEPALKNGTYTFTATQVDQAGNESPHTSPGCVVQVSLPFDVFGSKHLKPITNGDPSLTDPALESWEITASSSTETVVLDGKSAKKLKRNTSYTIGERLSTVGQSHTDANRYTQAGEIMCVDSDQAPLPKTVFDPSNNTLKVTAQTNIAEPIECTVTNQAAHVSFVTQKLGGKTALPDDKWEVALTSVEPGFDTLLDAKSPSAIARPGSSEATATVPNGMSLIGLQILDTARAECASTTASPTSAPESCWKNADAPLALGQGQHTVIRVIAASPADLPTLPVTGGMGSWVFIAAGTTVVATASAAYLWRRGFLRRASHGA
nr:Ig-like domain-containing protein [Leucobacter chinensis]